MCFRKFGIEGKFKKLSENGQILIDVYFSRNLIDSYYIE